MNQPPKKTWPSWKQGLLLFFGGIVLAVSFCAGAIASRDPWSGLLGVGFVASLFVILWGVVSLLIRMIRGG